MANTEKPYLFHSYTTTLCSHCAKPIPAKIVIRDGAVFLLKHCQVHGEHQELLEEDADFFLKRQQYDKPGTCTKTQTARQYGCPDDCGLCPDHEQHTCIALLEVTSNCDLRCPVCYAHSDKGDFLDLATIERMLDAYQDAESGEAEVLQISGGEPTTHPQIIEIIKLARAKGIRYVMLNTNGLRIAEDTAFVEALSQFVGGFEIYLQFDGFDDKVYAHFRGRDLSELKIRAIENLAKHRIPMTLVATVQRGVNDHEIGRIVDFGIRTYGVRGINFQPEAFFGRCPDAKASANRLTLTGVLQCIERQTNGMLTRDDFIPLPCDVDRVAVTILYRKGQEFIPITRHAQVRNFLPLVKNTLAYYPEDICKQAAEYLLSGKQVCACLGFLKDFLPMAPLGARALLSKDKVNFGTENVFRITVTSFIDQFNFDMKSMKKECVHVLTPNGKRIPFSAYNMRYRKDSTRDAIQKHTLAADPS